MMRTFFISFLALTAALFAADLAPGKTHAVLNVSYTNFDDVPQRNKLLTFVGQKNPENKISVRTDANGEAVLLIPREDSYSILCESLTGPFECGTTPYVSLKASTGAVNVAFDDTRAELQGVSFKVGSAELIQSSLATLNKTIDGLKKNAKAKVEIEGHTSSEGGEDYNQKLSEERAQSVRNYMIQKGIDGSRITAVGYGYSRPKASNDTEEGRKQNRRIEVRVTNPDEVEATVE
ncbi:MAG: OmpA family protein [Fibrobacteraceae bacterium]|nr:OmpA family protein [Fibrobacteraceae bacterium]